MHWVIINREWGVKQSIDNIFVSILITGYNFFTIHEGGWCTEEENGVTLIHQMIAVHQFLSVRYNVFFGIPA